MIACNSSPKTVYARHDASPLVEGGVLESRPWLDADPAGDVVADGLQAIAAARR